MLLRLTYIYKVHIESSQFMDDIKVVNKSDFRLFPSSLIEKNCDVMHYSRSKDHISLSLYNITAIYYVFKGINQYIDTFVK